MSAHPQGVCTQTRVSAHKPGCLNTNQGVCTQTRMSVDKPGCLCIKYECYKQNTKHVYRHPAGVQTHITSACVQTPFGCADT